MGSGETASVRELARLLRQCLREGRAVHVDRLGTFLPAAGGGFTFQPDAKPRVFLAYAAEDAAGVERLYDALEKAGFTPWMDRRKLLPGQNWPRAIEGAIETADFFVACFSKASVRKRGNFQSELRYALDCAREAQKLGLRNVFVSNGYMTPELLDLMAGLIHGINVDLKAGRGEFYRKISGAGLKAVLENLVRIHKLGIWLEVTTLVIPGLNDSDEELRWAARYLYDHLGPDVPWHISRFYPHYKMSDVPPTPPRTLERAWQIGRDVGLHYVYVGNLPGHHAESTFCPGCGGLVIERSGYWLGRRNLVAGKCAACGTAIAGVEM